MIPEELRAAFVSEAEQPTSIERVAEIYQKWASPEALSYFQSKNLGIDVYADLELTGFLAQKRNLEALLALPVLFTRLGFVTPEETVAAMEALSSGWIQGQAASELELSGDQFKSKSTQALRRELGLAEIKPYAVNPQQATYRTIPAALLELFWQQVEVIPGTNDIVESIINYGSGFDVPLRQAYNAIMLEHKGVVEAFEDGYLRPRLDIQELNHYPEGSLGHAYYHQIVDNGLDVDIVKGGKLVAISSVPDYVAQRVLQTHDLWHCVTNYTTSGPDEIALQAFQLAQIGSPFSIQLIATIATRETLYNPEFVPYVMQEVARGWQHGRKSPPFLPVRWEKHWGDQLENIRQEYGIQTCN